jgi:hypothetical protein
MEIKMKAKMTLVLVLVLLVLLVTAFPSSSFGQDITTYAQKATDYVYQTYHIPKDQLKLRDEQLFTDSLTGSQVWRGIVFNVDPHAPYYKLVIDANGKIMESEKYIEEWSQAYFEKYGKLSPSLYNRLKDK